MVDLATINLQFFLSLSVIFIGFLAKKLKILSEKDGQGIAKVIINITLPSLIIATISNIELDGTLLMLPFICLFYSIILFFFVMMIFKNESRQKKGVFLMTSLGFNIGLFAYPLIEGIFGNIGLVHIAMFDVGNAFIIFGLVYAISSIYSEEEKIDKKAMLKPIFKRMITNIPLISYLIALFINLVFGGIHGAIFDIFDTIAVANKALVLLLLGIYLNFNIDKTLVKPIMKVLSIRYGAGLLTGIILYLVFPFSEMFRVIILIALILPIGMAVIPFSIQFKYEENLIKLTGTLTNITIVISFCLMWILILILNI